MLAAPPSAAWARRGDDNKNRHEFYSIFEVWPEKGLTCLWVIGGRRVTADDGTEVHSGYEAGQVMGKTSPQLNLWKDPRDRQRAIDIFLQSMLNRRKNEGLR